LFAAVTVPVSHDAPLFEVRNIEELELLQLVAIRVPSLVMVTVGKSTVPLQKLRLSTGESEDAPLVE
jgi:hypothetical protein